MKTLLRFLPLLIAACLFQTAARAQGTGGPAAYKLAIISPASGTAFPKLAPIVVSASAVSSGTAAYTLDLLADGAVVATSRIATLVVVPPGVPLFHSFVWENAPSGTHALAVRHIDASGAVFESDPVKILVGPGDTVAPSITWQSPSPGAINTTPGIVTLSVVATDPLGEIRRVEFRDGTALIGVSEILTKDAIIPGRPRTHSWSWTNPPAGMHTVSASGTSSSGAKVVAARSLDVLGLIILGDVTVHPLKAVASEVGDLKSRTLVFEFDRAGDTGRDVRVFFALEGTATPGADYVRAPGPDGAAWDPTGLQSVVIPAGQSQAAVQFLAAPDNVVEGSESVVVRLVDSPSAGIIPPYSIGFPSSAEGKIVDAPPAAASIAWQSPSPIQINTTPGIVTLTVVATDPQGEIRRVEFREGTTLIGVSEILTLDAIVPGRPRTHSWSWTNPPAGMHTVTASGTAASGADVVAARSFDVLGVIVLGDVSVHPLKAVASEVGDVKSRSLLFEFFREGDTGRDVRVFYALGGTATPGTDYVRAPGPDGTAWDPSGLQSVLIPAGQSAATVQFIAASDNVVEGSESVVVRLVDSPSAGVIPPYSIGSPSSAEGKIVDSTPLAASIAWVQPSNGDRFAEGAPVTLVVEAVDPAGLLVHVDFLAGDAVIGSSDWNCPTCKMAPGATLRHAFEWKGAPAGLHTLRAQSKDAAGRPVVSAPVTITVDPVVTKAAATRRLPATFSAGEAFTVTIDVVPPAGTQAWVIEDRPPYLHEGGAAPGPDMPWWRVTRVDGGTFDGPNLAVKFGPFFGSDPRTLTYQVTPNDAAVDRGEFSGRFVADGKASDVGGDAVVLGTSRMPADLAPADDRISAEEATAYAAAWRLGKDWNGAKIPVDFVTRAGELWQQGEHYRFDPSAGPAPLWWVSAPLLVPSGGGLGGDVILPPVSEPALPGIATARWIAGGTSGGAALEVRTLPGPGVMTHAVEAKVPAAPATIEGSGVYDAASGVVRWGPFTDGQGRTLRCTFAKAVPAEVSGRASFAGHSSPLAVAAAVAGASAGGPRLVGVTHGADGAMHVVAEDAPGAGGLRLEYSTDLRHWAPVEDFTSGTTSFAKDPAPAGDLPRFYRAVRRP